MLLYYLPNLALLQFSFFAELLTEVRCISHKRRRSTLWARRKNGGTCPSRPHSFIRRKAAFCSNPKTDAEHTSRQKLARHFSESCGAYSKRPSNCFPLFSGP